MESDFFRPHLDFLYGYRQGEIIARAVAEKLERFRSGVSLRAIRPFNHADSILITYGDQFREDDCPPLSTLRAFCDDFLEGLVSGVHILPFFPYSSDDGFSVIDYRQVDPRLGGWAEVERIASRYRLMVDVVLNHCSQEHAWFRGFISGDPAFREYFITVDPAQDLSQVVRPRALPLLTAFQTSRGEQHVWTTFSTDQVDLNFATPAVLLEMVDILLDYLSHGTQVVRLDAIAYLWKVIGTQCVHLPQTHRAVQFFRQVLDAAAPGAVLITETNVPHQDNIAYFGDGFNEAQLVYNFALPPLTLHALQTGNGRVLTQWAAQLTLPSDQTTFFNFLASHDGIGLNPARGYLTEEEIEAMIERARRSGALVSYKTNPDGSQSPYELNANYLDALSEPGHPGGQMLGERRFIAAQAIMLGLRGVPGIYVHSLIGSRSWQEGAALTGHNRTINRQKFTREEIWPQLRDPTSARGRIIREYARLIRARASAPAFDPFGSQEVFDLHPGALVIRRDAQGSRVWCCYNLREGEINLQLPESGGIWRDLLDSGARLTYSPNSLTLQAYQVLWLVKE